jgi:hypothetical protein
MKVESGRRIQMGEPIVVGAAAMIPYQPSTPRLAPHETQRRTQGDRRIPPQIERPAEPARRGSFAGAPLAVMAALSGLAFAIAMFSSHVVG